MITLLASYKPVATKIFFELDRELKNFFGLKIFKN